jgi:hypothetical protein
VENHTGSGGVTTSTRTRTKSRRLAAVAPCPQYGGLAVKGCLSTYPRPRSKSARGRAALRSRRTAAAVCWTRALAGRARSSCRNTAQAGLGPGAAPGVARSHRVNHFAGSVNIPVRRTSKKKEKKTHVFKLTTLEYWVCLATLIPRFFLLS